MQQFEFHAYGGDTNGVVAAQPEVFFVRLSSESAAKSKAGRLAKKIDGPVDIAIAGAAAWNDRYLTTASPSEFHSAGYRCERID